MSNSSLVTVKQMNHTNYSNYADRKIDKIILHHAAGVYKTCKVGLDYFSSADAKKRQVSCHYVIGNDGTIGQSTDEKYRSWCSGGKKQDYNSITIEVSNADNTYNTISDAAMNSLIKLVADIAKRNNLGTLTKGKNVFGHKDFAATACPCYYNQIADICTKANAINTSVKTTTTTNKEVWVVQVGAFSDKTKAEAYATELKKKGINCIVKLKYDEDGDGKVTAADAKLVIEKSVGK